MIKCEIDNDVDSMPQWISGESLLEVARNMKGLKEKQVPFFSETMRGKDISLLLFRMDKLQHNAFYAGISNDYTVALSWLCHYS